MLGFFSPAIALMNRLKYPGKFAVTGVLACVSIAILISTLAIHLYESIRLARNELAATALIAPLQKQIQLTQQHRGISAVFLSGHTSLQNKLDNKQLEVNAALALADRVETRHSALLESRAEWTAV